jgi:hypothetical protein
MFAALGSNMPYRCEPRPIGAWQSHCLAMRLLRLTKVSLAKTGGKDCFVATTPRNDKKVTEVPNEDRSLDLRCVFFRLSDYIGYCMIGQTKLLIIV